MIAAKPTALSDVEAASVPVVACTAYQMLLRQAAVSVGQTLCRATWPAQWSAGRRYRPMVVAVSY